MTVYEELLQEADEQGISVDESYHFNSNLLGLYIDKNIALSDRLFMLRQKTDVLAEELEHYYATAGNILDQSNVSNRKQERLARFRAYNRRIGLSGIIKGYQNHCQNLHELAECLDVTEEFLVDALDCYKEKYGTSVKYKGHTIIFEPTLTVIESFMD